ncbi:urokinase plasminogen activator surface receptor [Cynoglossus semilaevis]|nr:urokinase plasminogen activator surface receptor [Cynoglossus semilaevis]
MLLLFIFSIVLLPKAFTLRCYECKPQAGGTCTETEKHCSTGEDRCGSFRVINYNGNSKVSEMKKKSCAMAAHCVQGSLDFGVNRTAIVSECCNSDLCNKQFPPDPKQSNPNGKKCYRCDGQTCTGTLNCKGDEDHCVSTIGDQKVPMKGCASKQICSKTTSTLLPGATPSEINCCEGNYCNSASSTSAGILILVTPLISLIFLS